MLQINAPWGPSPMKTAANTTVWHNPARDLAYAYPLYWQQAFGLLTQPDSPLLKSYMEDGGSLAELEAFALHTQKFLAAVKNRELPDLTAVALASDYASQPLRVRQVASLALFGVLAGNYFTAYRDCTQGSELKYSPLMDSLPKRSWWRRQLRAILTWMVVKL